MRSAPLESASSRLERPRRTPARLARRSRAIELTETTPSGPPPDRRPPFPCWRTCPCSVSSEGALHGDQWSGRRGERESGHGEHGHGGRSPQSLRPAIRGRPRLTRCDPRPDGRWPMSARDSAPAWQRESRSAPPVPRPACGEAGPAPLAVSLMPSARQGIEGCRANGWPLAAPSLPCRASTSMARL